MSNNVREDMDGEKGRLYRDSIQKRELIVILVACVLSLILFLGAAGADSTDHKTTTNVLLSTACSLLATVLFLVAYRFGPQDIIVKLIREEVSKALQPQIDHLKEQPRLLQESFAQSITSSQEQVVAGVISHGEQQTLRIFEKIEYNQRYYLPTETYRATPTYDFHLNQDLMNDLESSSTYTFRGVSGRFVAARLRLQSHHLSRLRVLVLNPCDDELLKFRVDERRNHLNHYQKPPEVVRREIILESFMSLVALYDCRSLCTDLEIAYGMGTSVSRLEIFDHCLYVSIAASVKPRKDKSSITDFPSNLRFSKDSYNYKFYCDDCEREFDRVPTIHIKHWKDDDLINHLLELRILELLQDSDIIGPDLLQESEGPAEAVGRMLPKLRNQYSQWAERFYQGAGLIPT